MADTKISGLTAVTSVVGAQEFAVNDAGTSKKATATQIKAFVNGLTFLGRTQLGANNANITVSFTAQNGFFIVVGHIEGYTGADIARLRPNGDTGTNYSYVAGEPQDAAASGAINAAGYVLGEAGQTTPRSPQFIFVIKPSASQVCFMSGIAGDGSVAKGTAITMIQHVCVWDNTTASISSFVLNGGAAGASLTTGSYLEVYGVRNA